MRSVTETVCLFVASLITIIESCSPGYGYGYGCPGGGLLSNVLGGVGVGAYAYAGGGGGLGYGRCGPPTIFYHWTCCDYNVYECCIQLEPWVIVLLVIFGIGLFLCCIGCIAACIWSYSRNR
ncbi:unnamed protein product [Cylicostephanus goldi]|uniref:Uncharacterized protein n=1 Tax=Cylicostephanus goldi TaxID=71465 RepID=A0A3P7N7Q9_CYLGO|nr:unnamed protein product [Cylicostephanus goldi]